MQRNGNTDAPGSAGLHINTAPDHVDALADRDRGAHAGPDIAGDTELSQPRFARVWAPVRLSDATGPQLTRSIPVGTRRAMLVDF
jgi:hypothetical protein